MFLLNTIMPQNNYNKKQINSGSVSFFKDIKPCKLLRKSNFLILKGASCLIGFQLIFNCFFWINLYQLYEFNSYYLPVKKDAVYDFLNAVSYNRRNIYVTFKFRAPNICNFLFVQKILMDYSF